LNPIAWSQKSSESLTSSLSFYLPAGLTRAVCFGTLLLATTPMNRLSGRWSTVWKRAIGVVTDSEIAVPKPLLLE
jgi:hypothetical protein